MAVIVLLALGCEPIYIPDPIDPRLPKYTQSGNNVAGALINDTLWESRFYSDPFITVDQPTVAYTKDRDTLVFTLLGKMDNDPYSTFISFGMRHTGVFNLQSMTQLNDTKYPLGTAENGARYGSAACMQTAGSGQLYCRSVKYDEENHYITLSGTFSFTISDPLCGDKVATYGRFDFRISSIQFF